MTNSRQKGPANGTAHHSDEAARLLAEWRAEASSATPDAGADRPHGDAWDRLRAIARAAWALPASDWAAIRLRAEIVQHVVWGDHYGAGLPRFENMLAGVPDKSELVLGAFDERAVAELVRTVLWAGEKGPAKAAPAPAAGTPDQVCRAPDQAVDEGEADEATVDALVAVDILAEEAKAGITTLRTLWAGLKPNEGIVPTPLGTSVWFCIDSIEARLDRIAARLDAILKDDAAPATTTRSAGASTAS